MPMIVASLVSGFIFGLGLLIAGMVDPRKVLAFLDVFGAWDPSLAVVMASALAVSSVGFRIAARRGQPLLAPQSLWPTRSDIDGRLLVGAVLFGLGWGLVGLCPGPALEGLATLSPGVLAFVAAMAAGIGAHDVWRESRRSGVTKAASGRATVDG
jgi:uncharacterized membrane protein YedE/YeeE